MSWRSSLWPEWQIEDEIGSGSYGTVYRIRRQDIGGIFYAALKVISVPTDRAEIQSLRASCMSDEQIAEYYCGIAKKISQEFAVMERLKGNTNIVSYEDHKIVPRPDGIGVDVLIRMELLTPMTRMIANGECGEAEAIKIGIDLCNGLSVCEREGILHRDIKPGNVFVSNHGNYKLGDFSVARMEHIFQTERTPQGTFSYMAPEMYQGRPYDRSLDIYSLGLILYRLLNNGRGPLLPQPPTALTAQMVDESNERRLKGEQLPPPANASAQMARIILKACAYRNTDRYSSAEQLRSELEACREEQGESAAKNAEAHNTELEMSSYFAAAGDL